MAERVGQGMARDRGLEVEVTSYGMSAEESGHRIDPRAAAVLEPAGYDAKGHTARQITRDVVDSSSLVVAAEPHQVDGLKRMSKNRDNVRLLNDFNPALPKGTPLRDPWYGDDAGFKDTLADIEAAMPQILDEIASIED